MTDKSFQQYLRDNSIKLKNKDPIKDWQTWIDLDNDDLKNLTYYLLHELVFNEVITSITKIIPFMDSNDIKVGVTLYRNTNGVYNTHSNIKHDKTPLFISTEDLVNVLNELIEEDDTNYMMNRVIFKIAWKLKIIDELGSRKR